jgi:FtsP/CotA-like multicopper oxidase with cupredoxin domain
VGAHAEPSISRDGTKVLLFHNSVRVWRQNTRGVYDVLDVASGHSFDIAFVADNPGVWMDHCHNLPHAAQGLVAHLMYAGLTDPYRVGGATHNQPE